MKNQSSTQADRQLNHLVEPSEVSSRASASARGTAICVVGGGFVGLVAAAGFAQFGHAVVCVEKDSERLTQLKTGHIPFFEPDLESLVEKNVSAGRLSFAAELEAAVEGQEAIFIAVGTPSSAVGRADMTALDEVAAELRSVLKPDQIVVLKSTVPLGTGDRIQNILAESRNGEGVASVVNNPEFLREGCAVYDFFHPQRIVLGGSCPEALETVAHIYRRGMIDPVPILTTNSKTAEMIKYASNAFLTTKIGFVNELAGLCDQTGVNVLEVARGMGMDSRIGPEFLDPGPGWGGSCFRKDMEELSGLATSVDHRLTILPAVLAANRCQHELVVRKIDKLVEGLKGKTIGVLGLAFKAGTSDVRDSAAIPIIKQLQAAGASVSAYDPKANAEAKRSLPQLVVAECPYETALDADCLVILTEWQEFQTLDWKRLAGQMRQPNLVDARNLLVPEQARRYGLNYDSMGQI